MKMIRIPLMPHGLVVIDLCDEWLTRWKWRTDWHCEHRYAYRKTTTAGMKGGMSTPLRDQRIGKRLALTGGVRMLKQADQGGTPRDNVLRMADWRNRVAAVPLEKLIEPIGFVPVPRYRALVPIYY